LFFCVFLLPPSRGIRWSRNVSHWVPTIPWSLWTLKDHRCPWLMDPWLTFYVLQRCVFPPIHGYVPPPPSLSWPRVRFLDVNHLVMFLSITTTVTYVIFGVENGAKVNPLV
jgi:hypothetical protein